MCIRDSSSKLSKHSFNHWNILSDMLHHKITIHKAQGLVLTILIALVLLLFLLNVFLFFHFFHFTFLLFFWRFITWFCCVLYRNRLATFIYKLLQFINVKSHIGHDVIWLIDLFKLICSFTFTEQELLIYFGEFSMVVPI